MTKHLKVNIDRTINNKSEVLLILESPFIFNETANVTLAWSKDNWNVRNENNPQSGK